MSDFDKTAMAHGYAKCHSCSNTQAIGEGRCDRCGATLHFRKDLSIQKTLAFLAAAIALYIPANVLPIMYTINLGRTSSSTIIGGVVTLFEHHSYGIAIIIFVASVFVPMAKMLILAYLCMVAKWPKLSSPNQASLLYRVTEVVGRWSMIDVFVVAVLVAMIQLGGIIAVEPGPAALSFAGVVFSTMLAAMSFDSRLIWDSTPRENEN
ncbi:paraquat-inducible protein A [Puniceicoccaceae bacterium K14]|nr:paraquat-inducible protein A [Puniceicoccaceae bacterium K14]